MNLVPKGRFLHWYFRRMRKPLKNYTSPTLPLKGCYRHAQPCPAPSKLRTFNLFEALAFFLQASTSTNALRPRPRTPPGRAGAPKTSALHHSNRTGREEPILYAIYFVPQKEGRSVAICMLGCRLRNPRQTLPQRGSVCNTVRSPLFDKHLAHGSYFTSLLSSQ